MNRWVLSEEVKKEYKPIIENFVNKMENLTVEEIEYMENEKFCLKLSDTKLNPHTLLAIMKELGYGNETITDNGWQLDFWINISKDGSYDSTCENLCISGCAMTFELNLSVKEFM